VGNPTARSGTEQSTTGHSVADVRAQVLLELLEREVRMMGLNWTAAELHGVFWRARQRWIHGEAEV
jgi:hypothetical protein